MGSLPRVDSSRSLNEKFGMEWVSVMKEEGEEDAQKLWKGGKKRKCELGSVLDVWGGGVRNAAGRGCCSWRRRSCSRYGTLEQDSGTPEKDEHGACVDR